MWADRAIIHLDMDAFFASVEQLDHPELKGRPVLVGHDGPRGVVSAASYEARRFGCHSAQPIAVAKRLCPQAVIMPVRGERYSEISDQMFAILDEYSPLVEPLSIDEAFVDLTGTQLLHGDPEDVALRLKKRIRQQLLVTASVGLAPNKFLAKLASDMRKPDGLMIIPPQDIDRILLPLPVTRIWGIGKATAAELEKLGIRTIAQLRQYPLDRLEKLLGRDARWFYDLARGIDSRPVVSDHEAKSIGREQTFEVDLADSQEVQRILLEQVEQVARRLRKQALQARVVAIKIRFGDFQTISRSLTLPQVTDVTRELWQAAQGLFARWPFQPVRLIGMTAERLSPGPRQLDLFQDPDKEKQKKLDSVSDRINQKFGSQMIKRGGVS